MFLPLVSLAVNTITHHEDDDDVDEDLTASSFRHKTKNSGRRRVKERSLANKITETFFFRSGSLLLTRHPLSIVICLKLPSESEEVSLWLRTRRGHEVKGVYEITHDNSLSKFRRTTQTTLSRSKSNFCLRSVSHSFSPSLFSNRKSKVLKSREESLLLTLEEKGVKFDGNFEARIEEN
jgi:hypothetical protein